jgi:uncharacterized membrane protein YagU involved in acid resistance
MTQARRYVRPVLLGGFIAGSIDVGAACLINKLPPLTILQAIASGVLGKLAFHSGLPAAVLGLVLQWAMSILIAVIFAAAAQRLAILMRRWVVSGLGYGVAVYFVMNFVVVPLSAAPFARKFTLLKSIEDLLAMLLFGLIIAYFGRQAAAGGTASSEPLKSIAT